MGIGVAFANSSATLCKHPAFSNHAARSVAAGLDRCACADITEMAPPKLRGALGVCFQLVQTVGILVAYVRPRSGWLSRMWLQACISRALVTGLGTDLQACACRCTTTRSTASPGAGASALLLEVCPAGHAETLLLLPLLLPARHDCGRTQQLHHLCMQACLQRWFQ